MVSKHDAEHIFTNWEEMITEQPTRKKLVHCSVEGSAHSFSKPNQREHVRTRLEEAITEQQRTREACEGGDFSL